MAFKVSGRTQEDDCSDRDDFFALSRQAERVDFANELRLKPLVGINADYRSARKDFPPSLI